MTNKRLILAAFTAAAGWLAVLATAHAAAPTAAAPPSQTRPAGPTTSPFDAADPEIGAIKRLNWRAADFDKLDLQSRAAALVGLNKLLDMVGAKAESRAELLVDYLDKNNLGSAFVAEAGDAGGKPAVTYEDAKKIAAAFIQTPDGQQKFGDEFTRSSPAEQARYLELYEKTARRKFDDAAEARVQVAAMAGFLEKQGKLDDFVAWSKEEVQRRQKAHEAELAIRAEVKAEQERERREQALAAAELRRQREQELAMKRLEYNYQAERSAAENNRRSYDDYGYGYGYGVYGPAAYYYGDAYRTAARGRIVNHYNTWNAGRPGGSARPVPGVWTRRR